MILHTLASQRAGYVERRGLIAERTREIRQAYKNHIHMLETVRPQAVAANATDDVFNIDAALIEYREKLRATFR